MRNLSSTIMTVLLLTSMIFVPVSLVADDRGMSVDMAGHDESSSRADPLQVPTWAPGDTWTYRTIIEDEDRYVPGTGTVHISWMSDNSTYTTANNRVDCDGEECYKLDFNGNSVMEGTAEGSDFSETDSNSGHYLYRVSDLAFVSGEVDSTSSITMAGISMTCNMNTEISTDTPLTQFSWPLEDGATWDVDTKISQSTTGSCTTPFGNMPVNDNSYTSYDYTSTVTQVDVQHSVYAGSFNTVEIHEVGEKDSNGDVQVLDQYNYYTPEVKRHINLTQEREQLKNYDVNFYPDLWVTDQNITVEPSTVTQDVPATVNVTIWNDGDEDASGIEVLFEDDGVEITTETINILAVGGAVNLSVGWTPSTPGQHNISIDIDPLNSIGEYVERNNMAHIDVDVAEPLPDLEVGTGDVNAPSETPWFESVTLDATVHNRGSLDATSVVVRFLDGTEMIGDEQSFDTVPQGDSVNPSVDWTPETLGTHTINVVVDPSDAITEMSEANNQISTTVEVVKLNYSFAMSVQEPIKEIAPNGTVDFQLSLENTGKKQDTMDLMISSPPQDWTAEMEQDSVTVSPGGTRTVKATLGSPPGAPAGTEVNLTVMATSRGDDTYKDSGHVVAQVVQVAQVYPELMTSAADLEGSPGDTVSYDVQVENAGNAPDTFSLSVRTQKQWTTTLSGSSSTGELQPGSEETVTLQTTIPGDALAEEKEVVTLEVVSQFDTTYKEEVTILVTCLQVHDLDITVTEPSIEIEPDNTATVTARITNDGNGDEEVNITLEGSPAIPGDWTVNVDESINVKSGRDKDLVFTIEIPEGSSVEEYTLTVKATVGVDVEETAIMTLRVLQVYELDLEVLPTTATVEAGKTNTFVVTVINLGNGQDTIDLSVEGLDPKVQATFSESEMTLDPGESREVTLTTKAKDSAKGSMTFQVTATSDDGDTSESETLNLSVKAMQEVGGSMTMVLLGVLVAGIVAVAVVVWYKRTH